MKAFFMRTVTLFKEHYLWLLLGIVLIAALIAVVKLGRKKRDWNGGLLAPLGWYSQSIGARRLTVNILGAALILWVVHIFSLWVTPSLRPSQLFTPPVVGPQPVDVTQAHTGALSAMATYTGDVKPWQDDIIYARVPGFVDQLNVYPGDRVRRGEILARLDLSALEPKLQHAEAQLAFWKSEYQRDSVLFHDGAISATQFDSTEMHYKAARAMVDLTRAQVSYATLRAPFDGIVAMRMVYPGVFVHPGSKLLKVDDLERLRIQFNVAEADLQWIHPGSVVYLDFPQLSRTLLKKAYPRQFVKEPNHDRPELRTTVAAVFPQENPMTKTGIVEVRIPNYHDLLKENTYVTGSFVVRSIQSGTIIPISALTTEPGGKLVVFVAPAFSSQGSVEERDVIIGLETDNWVQILKGIKPGEFVVTQGNRMLTDGQTVNVMNGEGD